MVYLLNEAVIQKVDERPGVKGPWEKVSMKTIGLIGGMSWESSLEYYRIINKATQARLGGFHSARSLMVSVDFAEIEAMQDQGRWPEMAEVLAGAARSLEDGGADFVILCTNTMHKVAGEIEASIHIPLLHIADATGQKIQDSHIGKVGLLGTRFTMEEDFYKSRLAGRYGLKVIVPDTRQREIVHRVIFDELVKGEIRRESREQYIEIIEGLARDGAEGVVLGCTEIGMLVHEQDCRVPLYDTTRIHAEAAVEYALAEVPSRISGRTPAPWSATRMSAPPFCARSRATSKAGRIPFGESYERIATPSIRHLSRYQVPGANSGRSTCTRQCLPRSMV